MQVYHFYLELFACAISNVRESPPIVLQLQCRTNASLQSMRLAVLIILQIIIITKCIVEEAGLFCDHSVK